MDMEPRRVTMDQFIAAIDSVQEAISNLGQRMNEQQV